MIDRTKITSRENRKLKHVRSVRDGRERAEIFIEGTRLTDEAVRSGIEFVEVFAAESYVAKRRNSGLLVELEARKVNMNVVSDAIFRSITDTENSQGIVLLARRPSQDTCDKVLTEDGRAPQLPLTLFLYRINNPSNLGAIIRTAEAAGVKGIMVSTNSADPFAPKSLRASMGSAFRIAITMNFSLDEAITQAESEGRITTAADTGGTQNYTGVDWSRPRLLIFGSEAHGLEARQMNGIKELIRIPMKNGVESLNLAVSCGIVLFEAARQNELK